MEKGGLGKKLFNIQIDNFGPINHAEFDIKPLTVFTGPNNSGKSYSSMLIHALTHYIPESQKGIVPDFWSDLTVKSLEKLLEYIQGDVIEPELSVFAEIDDYLKQQPSKSDMLHIKKTSINFLIKEGIGKFYIELLQQKIESSFDSKLSKLVSHGENNFKIHLNDDFEAKFSSDYLEIVHFPEINFKHLEKIYYPNIRFKVNEENVLLDLDYEDLINKYDDDRRIVILILMQIYLSVGTPILKKLFKNRSYYIPTIKSSALKNLDVSKLDNSEFHNLSERLESEIIGGNIIFMEPSDGFPEFFYGNKEFKIPIHLASSSISELTPIFIYLKKILKKGDTLILEEPEAHLHPENQRILVKYIVRLINQGLNFIITTHSDYILEQVANMVLLKDVPEKDRIKEFGYERDDFLDREQVGIYLFEKKGFKGYITEEIEIGELGIPESSFTHVIDSLYGESHNIKKYLFG